MKTILLIAVALLLWTDPLPAQTKSDSTTGRVEKLIDENANGIDDRLEGKGGKKGKRRARGRDRFIDADGDGICDGRETGLGFRGRKTPDPGKRGPKRGGGR